MVGEWIKYNGQIPRNAVEIMPRKNKISCYLGRAKHEGNIVPAQIKPNLKAAYLTWKENEHKKTDFEILCSDTEVSVAWQLINNSKLPSNAFPVGKTSDSDEDIFVGRTLVKDTMVLGNVFSSIGSLTFAQNRQETELSSYEILVINANRCCTTLEHIAGALTGLPTKQLL